MDTKQAVQSPWLRFVLLLGVVLVSVTLFFEEFDPSGVFGEISDANILFITFAVIVYTASWYPRGLRYRDLLIAMGHFPSTRVMTGAVFISQTANLVFPARAGDATRAYVVNKRSGVPYTTGVASLTAERFLDVVFVGGFAALGVLGALLIGVPGEVGEHTGVLLGSGVLFFVVVVGTGAVVLLSRYRFGGSGRGLPFLTEGLTEVIANFANDVAAIFENGRRLFRLSSTSLAGWGLDVLACAFVFYAFGVTGWVVVPASLLGVGVGNLAKAVPSTPGGIGVYEAGFAASVTAVLPLGWEVVLGVAVIDHALKNGVTVIGGVVSAVVLNVSLTQRVLEGKAEREAG